MVQQNIELGDLTDKNIGQLKLLNSTTLAVTYDDKFYQKLLGNGFITKLAYFNDILVGAVSCRIDPPTQELPHSSLYIMTFGVLAPYRNLGIGKKLLEFVESLCLEKNYQKISLHVQVGSEAIDFYKKYNFIIESTVNNYYRHIEPPHCYIMAKSIKKQ
ncbi:GCN5-related N-acetyltransferase [Tieghemostelium lacteum]|uniref:GCN5-related N-acetyltransferase n=1 Tax=Tieghemostelium lacteum TaxID=361077 RepID=A0A151ZIE7_TIELA|nr:GCN5-related N-acetyltransferase [Tieghemostelium lacteum]|eukprot:KYQ93687.1 GCN5-related N-acetyltransferase [Tieghemostelium lacteum]